MTGANLLSKTTLEASLGGEFTYKVRQVDNEDKVRLLSRSKNPSAVQALLLTSIKTIWTRLHHIMPFFVIIAPDNDIVAEKSNFSPNIEGEAIC